jgi:hypothetical protein
MLVQAQAGEAQAARGFRGAQGRKYQKCAGVSWEGAVLPTRSFSGAYKARFIVALANSGPGKGQQGSCRRKPSEKNVVAT